MKSELVSCGIWMIKDLHSKSYFWPTAWTVVSSVKKKNVHPPIHLECVVSNNNMPLLLATSVHLVLIGLTESKFLLVLF